MNKSFISRSALILILSPLRCQFVLTLSWSRSLWAINITTQESFWHTHTQSEQRLDTSTHTCTPCEPVVICLRLDSTPNIKGQIGALFPKMCLAAVETEGKGFKSQWAETIFWEAQDGCWSRQLMVLSLFLMWATCWQENEHVRIFVFVMLTIWTECSDCKYGERKMVLLFLGFSSHI